MDKNNEREALLKLAREAGGFEHPGIPHAGVEPYITMTESALSGFAELVRASLPAAEQPNETWLRDGGLVYSLRDGTNYYEVNVTMVAGSRETADRAAFAERLRAMLAEQPQQAVSDEQIKALAEQHLSYVFTSESNEVIAFARALFAKAAEQPTPAVSGECPTTERAIQKLLAFKDLYIDDIPPENPVPVLHLRCTEARLLAVEFARLRAAFSAPAAQQPSKELSVTSILLDVVPGEDGMGEEVYAKSADEVVARLTALSNELEELKAQQPSETTIHNAAIEKAAKVCEEREDYMGEHAQAIRSLLRPAAQEAEKPTAAGVGGLEGGAA